MALFAIGDLHLSSNSDKPMDVFGSHWLFHHEKIRSNWLANVSQEDTVLIAGDISWAMRLQEATADLSWISALPGNKILIRGNHDYWWSSITRLNSMFEGMRFIQNNYFTYQEFAICGTRGWISPNKTKFTEEDNRIFTREARRLELSLEAALQGGHKEIIAMLHYPPTNDLLEPSLFTQLLEKYGVAQVVYGHLHGEESYAAGLQGEYRNINYHLVSCDYLNFDLKKIL